MTRYAFDDFELDDERLELRRSGKVVKVDALVLRVLRVLVRRSDQLVTKDELVAEVWEGRAVADNVLTVSVARLRKALGHARGVHEPIETEYGRGYRFARNVQTRAPHSGGREVVDAPAQTPSSMAPPFVGRTDVLARLQAALQSALAGRGSACVLLGEAGIGKTRTVEALQPIARGLGFDVAWSYCHESAETPPLSPWLQLLSALGRDAPARLTSAALIAALAQAAARKPLVLVLDDVHRADAASLELLGALVDALAPLRAVVIATLRSSLKQPRPRAETHLPYVLGHRNTDRIPLERLGPQQVAAYVGALIDDPDERFARAVFAKSEGNPFFMVELARPLPFAENADPEALAVLGSALEGMRQTLARLSPDTLAVLRVASVLGRAFDLAMLVALTAQEPGAVAASLDDALTEGVVVAAQGSRTAFAFGHELLRSVLYDQLGERERRRTHCAAADALEARRASGEACPPSELAFHLRAALPESDARRTVKHCREAADQAALVFANLDVVRYLRHALEALELVPVEPGSDSRARLRMRLLFGIALYARANAPREHTRALSATLQLAHELSDASMLVQAARLLAYLPGFAPTKGGPSAALEHALRLFETHQAPENNHDRAIAIATLACAPPYCFDRARCVPMAHEALALARSVNLASALHPALRAVHYLEPKPELGEELTRLGQQHPAILPVLPAELALRHAVEALQRGELPQAQAELERAIERCHALNGGALLWHCERMLALSRWHAGACAQSVRELEVLHGRARALGFISTDALCAADRVFLARALREPGELCVLSADDRAALMLDVADPPSVWALKVHALVTGDAMQDARTALHAVPCADLARLPEDGDQLGTLAHLARAAAALGELDYGQTLYTALAPHAQRFAAQASFWCEGAVPQLLGGLSHALGRLQDAITWLEQAVAMNARAGLVPQHVDALLALAHALRAHGKEPRRVRALATQAQALATAHGLARAAHEAAALL